MTIAGLAALAGGAVGTLITSRQLKRRRTESQSTNTTSDDTSIAAHGQQLKQCNAIPTNGGTMHAQKRDPFDPRPREGWAMVGACFQHNTQHTSRAGMSVL